MNGSKLTLDKLIYKHDPVIHNFSAARQILPYLLRLKLINSVLDVGCGTGTWLSVAKDLGVSEISGIDGVNLTQSELKIPSNNFIVFNLSQPFNLHKKFDLLICLEVAEHLPESAAITLVDTLTRHSDFILFSAAIPGQGGQNHINEQWPHYWVSLFSSKGYFPCNILNDEFWNNEEVEWWYRQNMVIYGTKGALSSLNLSISEDIHPKIHPALFKEKLDKINELEIFINNEVWHPSFKKSFRNLLKSIIK